MHQVLGQSEERAWAEKFQRDQIMEEGYRTQQANAAADSKLCDDGQSRWASPPGLSKSSNSWSDTKGDDIESVYSMDAFLTNIMVYVTTRTFNTASWIYYGRREEGGRDPLRDDDRRVEVPTACALFPGRNARLAAALLCRAALQRSTMDRDAPRRPFCCDGRAGTPG